MPDTPTRVTLPMVCVCKPDRLADADEARAKVLALLRATDLDFLTSIVMSFEVDFDGRSIQGILMDQWSSVSVEHWRTKEVIRVECDRVEDGLVAIWLYLYEHVGMEE